MMLCLFMNPVYQTPRLNILSYCLQMPALTGSGLRTTNAAAYRKLHMRERALGGKLINNPINNST